MPLAGAPGRRTEHLAAFGLTLALGLAMAAVVVAEGRAEAATPRTSSLGWVRLEGAETCIGTHELAGLIERRLGRPVFVSAAQADLSVEGRVERLATGGYHAVITLTNAAGEPLGVRELEIEQSECHSLDAPLTLAIALMIDPDAALRPKPPLPPLARPALVVRHEDRPLSIVPPTPQRPFSFAFQGEALFSAGILPTIGTALQLRVRLDPPSFAAIEFGGSVSLRNEAIVRTLGSTFNLTDGFLELCPFSITQATLRIDGCLGARVGVIHVESLGFTNAFSTDRPYASAAIEGRITRRLIGPLHGAVGLGLLFPLTRDRFYFQGSAKEKVELFRPSPLAGTLALALGVEIP